VDTGATLGTGYLDYTGGGFVLSNETPTPGNYLQTYCAADYQPHERRWLPPLPILLDQIESEFHGIMNILADRVETVTPWLARKVLENERHGVRIKWLSTGNLMGRFLAAPFRKRDLLEGQA